MSVKLRNTQSVVMSRLGVWSCFSYSSGTDTTVSVIWYCQHMWKSTWKEYENMEMLISKCRVSAGEEGERRRTFFLEMWLIQQGTKR